MSKRNKVKIEDNSPKIHQGNKIKEELTIKPFKWTEKQQRFIDVALDKKTKIILLKAPPGVGKTLLSTYCCLELLNKKSISDIIYFRNPIESSSKGIGFIPGEKDEKMENYGYPLFDHLYELLPKSQINGLVNDEKVKIESIGFSKGRTYNGSGLIIDESEDLNIQELRLLLCRIGKFSKMFIIGDEKQSNIKNSGFEKVFNAFDTNESKENGIQTFEFTRYDCMRSDITRYIIEIFDNIS